MPKFKTKGLNAFLEWSSYKGPQSSSRRLTNLAYIVPGNQENKQEVSALLEEAASCDDQDLEKIVQLAYGINLAEFRGTAEALTVSRSVSAIGKQESDILDEILGFSTKQVSRSVYAIGKQESDILDEILGFSTKQHGSESRPKSSGLSRRDIETNNLS